MKTATQLFLPLIISLLSFSAFAGGFSEVSLRTILSEEIRHCPKLDCQGTRVQFATMSEADFANLSKDARAIIRDKMIEIARDIWPDTILEGPYYAKFNIRIERDDIQMLIVDGQWAGYRVSFSDKAWDLDHCSASEEVGDDDHQDLSQCETGRIYDRGFVSNDLSYAFRDESSFSNFQIEPKQ